MGIFRKRKSKKQEEIKPLAPPIIQIVTDEETEDTMEHSIVDLSGITNTQLRLLSKAGVKSGSDLAVLDHNDLANILPNATVVTTRKLSKIARYIALDQTVSETTTISEITAFLDKGSIPTLPAPVDTESKMGDMLNTRFDDLKNQVTELGNLKLESKKQTAGYDEDKITVPRPDGLKDTDSWKGTISRNTLGKDITDICEYTITHKDGSKTLRMTIEKDGVKISSKDKKVPPPAPVHVPVRVPSPEPAPVRITNADPIHVPVRVPRSKKDEPETLTVPAPNDLAEGDGWSGSASKKTSGGDTEIVYDYEILHADGDKTLRTVTIINGKKTTKEKIIETQKPIAIPPPDGLSSSDSWKGVADRKTVGAEKTTTYTYTIFHKDGSETIRKVVELSDGTSKVTNKEKPALPYYKPPQKEEILPPKELPYGCAWKAKRNTTTDSQGMKAKVTKYTITGDSQGEEMNFEQIETIICNKFGDVMKYTVSGGRPGSEQSSRIIIDNPIANVGKLKFTAALPYSNGRLPSVGKLPHKTSFGGTNNKWKKKEEVVAGKVKGAKQSNAGSPPDLISELKDAVAMIKPLPPKIEDEFLKQSASRGGKLKHTTIFGGDDVPSTIPVIIRPNKSQTDELLADLTSSLDQKKKSTEMKRQVSEEPKAKKE